MTDNNPYDPPAAEPESTPQGNAKGWQQSAPAIGCGTGGCLLPVILFFFFALVSNDVGGPLFLPIVAVFTGMIGLAIGCIIKAAASK